MQKVSTLSDGITNNLLAIDAMNRQASSIGQISDPRAVMYIRDMEQRARQRLLKYHYYMAKAYEYRLLESYPQDLNIQSMFDKMKDIASFDGTLTATDFDALKVIYEDQLRDLAENIIDRFMQGDYGWQLTTSYRLSPEEIDRLNSTNQVTINFIEKGLILSSRENIRIVNLTAGNVVPKIVGTPPVSFGQLIVKMRHSGISRIQDANQFYVFRHINPNSPKHEMLDISWLWEWDIIGNEIQQREMSDASKSLLAAIVGDEVYENEYVLLSRPSAWADIVISKEVNADTDCTIDIEPNGLTLQIQYDYYEKDPGLNLKTLVVSTEPNGPKGVPDSDVLPYFVVDKVDEAGRRDGRGNFRRIYTCGNSVRVTAIAYNNWEFQKWTNDRAGNILRTTSPTVKIDMDTDPKECRIYAQYQYVGPPPDRMDYNEDFSTDSIDFSGFADIWLSTPADERWNPAYDVSDPPDDIIDMLDISQFVEHWLSPPK